MEILRFPAIVFSSFVLLASMAPMSSAQQQLETFVLTVAGNPGTVSGCSTSSNAAPVAAYFGTTGLFVPVPGIAPCGLAGGSSSRTSATSPLSDSLSLATGGSFSTNALSRYGALHAIAHAANAAVTSYRGAEAMALARDVFTITSPSVANGAAGTVQFLTTATGSLTNTTTTVSTADVELYTRVNGVGPSLLMRAQADSGLALPFLTANAASGTLNGFTRANGFLSGSQVLRTNPIPFVFGTPFSFHLGLLAYASSPGGSSTVDVDFEATLTGIEVRNASNQLVTSFVIQADSGTPYDAGGLVTPALPTLGGLASIALAATLLLAGAFALRRRRIA